MEEEVCENYGIDFHDIAAGKISRLETMTFGNELYTFLCTVYYVYEPLSYFNKCCLCASYNSSITLKYV